MAPQGGLRSLLHIRPGEGRPVLLVLVFGLLLSMATSLARTAAFSLFLAAHGSQTLPYAYLGVSALTTAVSFVYLKVSGRLSLAVALLGTLGFLLLTAGAFRLGLGLTTGGWLLFALPIWWGMFNALAYTVFWNLAGRLFNLQQGKRLFGLFGAADLVGIMLVGFLTPPLVAWLGAPNLLLAAAGLLAGALAVLVAIVRSSTAQLAVVPEAEAAAPRPDGALLGDRYVRLLFLVFTLFIIGVYFVDNIFYAQAELRYPDDDALAGFLGAFFGVVGALSLVMQTALTGRLIGRYGVRSMILVTPLTLGAGAALIALTGTLFAAPAVIFWLAVLANLARCVLDAVDNAAVNVLYQPLPAMQRTRAQTVVDGILYPAGVGLAGLALLALRDLLGLDTVRLAYVLLGILAAWLAGAVLLGRAYPARLLQALAKRHLDGTALAVADRSSVAALRQGLTSPHVGVVAYSLDLLEALDPAALPDSVPALLEHRAADVRLDVLRRIERLGLTATLPAIRQRLHSEGSRQVQGASLRTMAALGGPELLDEVVTYLSHPDRHLRHGALVGLLRGGELAGTLAAGERLGQLVASPDPAEREFAAQVLGDAGMAGFNRPVEHLLRDEAPGVRRAALVAAGKLRHPRLWPLVVEGLASPHTRAAAMTALVAGGEGVLPEISAAFARAGQERAALIRLARACGRIGGDRAIALLQEQLADPAVRSEALAALSRCGYRATEATRPQVHREIRAEVAQVTWTLAALRDLGDDHRCRLLRSALREDLARQRARIFWWLSLLYDPHMTRRVQDGLDHGAAEQRAYALEILEIQVAPALKAMLVPVFDELSDTQRLQRLSRLFPQQRLDAAQRLQEIIAGAATWLTPWTSACALYAAGQLAAAELARTVDSARSSPAPLVGETAAWAFARLEAARRHGVDAAAGQDGRAATVRTAPRLDIVQEGVPGMLLLIEKVILLKGVDFFAEAPEEALAELAAVLEEVEVPEGELILAGGTLDARMYVIVEGRVRAHDGQHTRQMLGAGDVFGELALLAPAPQPTSLTALTDTRLLRLDREPLHEFIAEQSQVARRMLEVLALRLQRAQVPAQPGRLKDDVLSELQERLARADQRSG